MLIALSPVTASPRPEPSSRHMSGLAGEGALDYGVIGRPWDPRRGWEWRGDHMVLLQGDLLSHLPVIGSRRSPWKQVVCL